MNIAKLLVPSLVLLAACSSTTSSPSGSSGSSGAAQDKGLAGSGDTSASSAPDTNPDGVAYPTANIGTSARNGTRPGNTIQNFKFLGYPDGDVSKGLQPISMAQLFDPTGTKSKLIHIQASGSWCIHCQAEAQAVTPMRQMLLDRKVTWIISLAEGSTPGTAATAANLNKWIAEFKAPYTHFLDPANANLGQFYDAAALPWNANINAKTMEILSSDVGGLEKAADVLGNVDTWLSQIDNGTVK